MKEQAVRLGPREQQVVELLLQGCDNAEIIHPTRDGKENPKSRFQPVVSAFWNHWRYQASELRYFVVPETSMSAIGRYGNRVPSQCEHRVIELVAEGLKNKEVAEAIGTTEDVVKNYLKVIYDKLGLWSRLELALWHESRRGASVQ